MANPQLTLTVVDESQIHPSHTMVYAPCVHRECKNCWSCICHGQDELKEPCQGLTLINTLIKEKTSYIHRPPSLS